MNSSHSCIKKSIIREGLTLLLLILLFFFLPSTFKVSGQDHPHVSRKRNFLRGPLMTPLALKRTLCLQVDCYILPNSA